MACEEVDGASSLWHMLLEELLESLHLQAVVDVGVGVKCWCHDGRLPPACCHEVLLAAHVVMRESGQLASLPTEVTLVPGHVQRAEEEQPIGNH